jgi:hypothetical protein
MLKVVRFVNLVLAGLLAGNELGTKVAIHPSLDGEPPHEGQDLLEPQVVFVHLQRRGELPLGLPRQHLLSGLHARDHRLGYAAHPCEAVLRQPQLLAPRLHSAGGHLVCRQERA